MTPHHDRLRGALAQIDDSWSSGRAERTLAGVQRRARRKRVRHVLSAASAVAAVIAVGFVAWPRQPPADRAGVGSQPAAARAELPRHMQFEDGSRVELLDPSARLIVDEVTPERIVVRLLGGKARVDVVPRKERAFRVQCGDVAVEVLGTAFELARDGERTRVEVLRGRVAVHWPGGSNVLAAGEAGWFPKPVAEPLPPMAAGSVKPAKKAHDATWQAQAERGNFKRAYELLPERVSDDVQELLLAADAARLSGHPAEAVPYLRRVIERHPRDPRASLAAFTLGGVLLNQLDRPREAEAAYARARSLALSPALAQDALARQVEAAERVGDAKRVRELAQEYVRRYPDGRRIQWVRELSGL